MGVREQVSWASRFLCEKHTRVITITFWMATFSGALHSSLTTYFLLEIGADPDSIGRMFALQTAGTLILSPCYGWALDRGMILLPTLASSFCCSFGCLVRGLAPTGRIDLMYLSHIILGLGAANFWNVTGAYLAMAFNPKDRCKVLSAYRLQLQILQVLARVVYSPWDLSLQNVIPDDLIRHRFTMSVCSVLCILGFFMLVFFGSTMKIPDHDALCPHTKAPPMELGKKRKSSSEEGSAANKRRKSSSEEGTNEALIPQSTSNKSRTGKETSDDSSMGKHGSEEIGFESKIYFFIFCFAILFQNLALTIFSFGWPLYVKRAHGWESHEFNILSLLWSLASIAFITYFNRDRFLCPSLLLAAVLGALVLYVPDMFTQCLVAILMGGALNLQRPLMEARGSLLVPQKYQARALLIMNMCQGLAAVFGNWFGPSLEDSFFSVAAASMFFAASMMVLVPHPDPKSVSVTAATDTEKLSVSDEDPHAEHLKSGERMSQNRVAVHKKSVGDYARVRAPRPFED